jgi:membrane protein implicated in regulation of membrane protease activity
MVVQVIIWFAIFIGLLVVEALTADVLMIWFMPGALICIILAAFSVPLPVQIAVFFVVSIAMFILSKTALKKFFATKKKEKTNLDLIIGETGIVMEDIDNVAAKGSVKVNFQLWTARSKGDADGIKAGDKVKIIAVEGVKLICEKID